MNRFAVVCAFAFAASGYGRADAAASPKPKTAATAAATASPVPTATPLPTPLERATAILAEVQTGKVDRGEITPAFASELTPDVVARYAATLRPFATAPRLSLRNAHDVDGVTTYDFIASWPAGSIDYVLGLDDRSGKIAKLYFRSIRS